MYLRFAFRFRTNVFQRMVAQSKRDIQLLFSIWIVQFCNSDNILLENYFLLRCHALFFFVFFLVCLDSACNEVCYKFNLYSCKLSAIRAHIRQRMALAADAYIYTFGLHIRMQMTTRAVPSCSRSQELSYHLFSALQIYATRKRSQSYAHFNTHSVPSLWQLCLCSSVPLPLPFLW